MKLLILFQVLMITVKICKPEDEPNTTVIVHDTRTEMSVEQVNNLSRSHENGFFDSLRESDNNGIDLDFDYDDGQDVVKADADDSEETKEQEMQEALLKAMRKPGIRKQIGEVIPILRVMSPAQRLTLAALVSSQIMSQNTPSESNLTEMAAMLAGKNVEDPDDRHNITEHLLLPISMDIAKMFKGLGKEMGRNLRQNFHRPYHSLHNESKFRKALRTPPAKVSETPNRRMDHEVDEMDYEEEESEEDRKPVAEALKQPGKDECDFFTKNLCLEVSNYPTEAIISSLKKNKDIAKTFLTDFEVNEQGPRRTTQGNSRQLERRQDGQNEIKESTPGASYMCPSTVKYARPKRARATSGQWKYIVNAGDYTQTLRLEICQKPKSPCSYVTNHLNSECSQVFNYHRLLTWDEIKGLHMDIFKVPSCCSCHVQGYSTFYPPNKDFVYAEKRREPSDVPEYVPALPEHPSYNSVGNKREVLKPVPLGIPPVTSPPQFSLNIKEFPRNPVDHLVPPGPPLPLDNESEFLPQADIKYGQKVGVEHNRRFPITTEHTRLVNRATERIEMNEPPAGPSLPRFKPQVLQKPKHPGSMASAPQEPNPVFDSTNQIYFLKPSANTPPPFRGSEPKRGGEGGLFATPKPNDPVLPPPKVKSPVQYFQPHFNDVKSLPSRVNPFYVTPPSKLEVRPSTTPAPVQKPQLLNSSGQKKINYNYHPIIDFFTADARKRQAPAYPSPQYLPQSSQDWTPVLGR